MPNADTHSVADYRQILHPLVPECSIPAMEQNLRLAITEFCERARAWREISEVTIDEQNETLVTPEYAVIHEIEYAWFDTDECPLMPIAYTKVHRQLADPGEPESITQIRPGYVSIYPFKAGTLHISAFLKPRTAYDYTRPGPAGNSPLHNFFDQAPVFLFHQHAETIAHGAAARCMMLKSEGCYDPQMAAFFGAKFNADVTSIYANQVGQGQMRTRLRTQANYV